MTDANEHYLRKNENEMVTAEEYREEKEIKINQQAEILKYNRDSVTEALREATYSNELELSQLQIAYVNKNMEKLGKLVYDLIEKELKLEAERIVD